MSEPQIDELIIKHLADLEAASRRMLEIEERVADALDEAAKEWADVNGWRANAGFNDDDLWLVSGDWYCGGDDPDAYWGWFLLGPSDQDGYEAQHWLSQLSGIGPGSTVIRWLVDRPTKRTALKRLSAEFVVAMRQHGFMHDEKNGTFYMPFTINIDALAEAVKEDAFDEALQPLKDALDRAADAKPVLDELIRRGLEVESM